MSLSPGTRLGPYEVTAQIGVGGMGEVYRATDTNLKRQVAIKVLPEAVAADPDRLARFKREAEVLAALNHPNIAQIYGLEKSDGMTALVMELVEGPTLADRIAKGRIPVDEVLPMARQITDALEAAHERGIIHRDLKPANVKVREDGTVKVLDFGLAKALEPAGATASTSASMSPTITSPAMTDMGMILGTAAYMAPEQARGKPVDKRADIWAFGCVLYEMLTGRQAFDADDVSATLADVIRGEPDWEALPADLSPVITKYLQRCLAKDSRQRVGDIQDVRLALSGAFDIPVATAGTQRLPGGGRPRTVLSVSLVAVGAAAIAGWLLLQPRRTAEPTRLTVVLPASQELTRSSGGLLAMAPDGRTLVYGAFSVELRNMQLFRRPLGEFEAEAIAGTAFANEFFFSHDGRWLAFVDLSGNRPTLKKVPVEGGTPETIVALPGLIRGATWTAEDDIIVGLDRRGGGLARVPAAGGALASLCRPDTERFARYPQIINGGSDVLFTLSDLELGSGELHVLNLETCADRVLVQQADIGRAMDSGHLVFVRGRSLFAAPFAGGDLRGDAVELREHVRVEPTGNVQVVLGRDGPLAYIPGPAQGDRQLAWVGLNGQEESVGIPSGDYVNVSVSPDGRRAALGSEGPGGADVFVAELGRGELVPLTRDPGFDGFPLWTPDGERIVYSAIRGGSVELRWQRADGTDQPVTLQTFGDSVTDVRPTSWTSDRRLVATIKHVDGNEDIALVTLEAPDEDWVPHVATADVERRGVVSPDGRWLAYQLNGRQIYVETFPGRTGRRLVTVGSDVNTSPEWAVDSRSVYFLRGLGQSTPSILAVDIGADAAGRPIPGDERTVLDYRRYLMARGWYRTYDVARTSGGERFLTITAGGTDQSLGEINVVLNFAEELRRLVPTP